MKKPQTNLEKFILLARHPEKQQWLLSRQILHIGMAGAIILDLAEQEVVSVSEKYIRTKKDATDLSPAHQHILARIKDKQKPRKVKRWVTFFSHRAGQFRWKAFEKMERDGLISITQHHFLMIGYRRVHVAAKDARQQMISELKKAVLQTENLNASDGSLLNLLMAVNLSRPFAEKSSERKAFRKSLKEKLDADPIANGVTEAIREMQAAIAAAAATGAAGTAAGTN